MWLVLDGLKLPLIASISRMLRGYFFLLEYRLSPMKWDFLLCSRVFDLRSIVDTVHGVRIYTDVVDFSTRKMLSWIRLIPSTNIGKFARNWLTIWNPQANGGSSSRDHLPQIRMLRVGVVSIFLWRMMKRKGSLFSRFLTLCSISRGIKLREIFLLQHKQRSRPHRRPTGTISLTDHFRYFRRISSFAQSSECPCLLPTICVVFKKISDGCPIMAHFGRQNVRNHSRRFRPHGQENMMAESSLKQNIWK